MDGRAAGAVGAVGRLHGPGKSLEELRRAAKSWGSGRESIVICEFCKMHPKGEVKGVDETERSREPCCVPMARQNNTTQHNTTQPNVGPFTSASKLNRSVLTRHGCSGPDWHPKYSLEIILPSRGSTSSLTCPRVLNATSI